MTHMPSTQNVVRVWEVHASSSNRIMDSCVETPESPCKVIKCYYRNVIGCEDENLVCRTLWRSQAPLESWSLRVKKTIRFVFVTILVAITVCYSVYSSRRNTYAYTINIHLSRIYRSILNEIQRAFSILEQDVLIVLRTGAFFAHSVLLQRQRHRSGFMHSMIHTCMV